MFRETTAADIPRLIGMMRDYYAFDHLAFDEAIARRALEELVGDSSLGRVWLIEAEREVAGYAVLAFGFSLEYHGRDAFIDELYLSEAFRGRGLGKRVIAFLESYCREHGIRALHLEVERENTAAQELYRRTGFKENGRFLLSKRL